jgi:hypothetical protein
VYRHTVDETEDYSMPDITTIYGKNITPFQTKLEGRA